MPYFWHLYLDAFLQLVFNLFHLSCVPLCSSSISVMAVLNIVSKLLKCVLKIILYLMCKENINCGAWFKCELVIHFTYCRLNDPAWFPIRASYQIK